MRTLQMAVLNLRTLEGAGYQGWYVIEQDCAITGDLPATGDGPVK